MKPIDFRNATWAEVREHVTEDMRRVHEAYLKHGANTTRALATLSGISVFTLRPRTTDLFQCGLVDCVGSSGREGIYEYRSDEQAMVLLEARQRAAMARQSPGVHSTAVSAAARIMGQRAHDKPRQAGTGQLELLPAT